MLNGAATRRRFLHPGHQTPTTYARIQGVKRLAQSLLVKLKRGDRGGILRICNWIAAVTVALVSLGGASSADASPITTLFSTGVDAFGVPLAGGFVDPHYTVS